MSARGSRTASDASDQTHPPYHTPLKVLGQKGLYLTPSTPYLESRWKHLFPLRTTRLAASIALCIAIGVGIAWVTVTIKDKWIATHSNPTTTLNSVDVASVPVLPGLATFWHNTYWFNQTLAQTLNLSMLAAETPVTLNPDTPLPNLTVPNPIPHHEYSFHEVFISGVNITADVGALGSRTANLRCEPSPIFSTPFFIEFCVPDNWYNIIYNYAPWPTYFNTTLDTMCIRSYKLLNEQSMVQIDSFEGNVTYTANFNTSPYESPAAYLLLMDLDTLRTVNMVGHLDVLTQASQWSSPLTLTYNQRHYVQHVTSKRVLVSGDEVYHTELVATSASRYRPDYIGIAWNKFLRANPDIYTMLANDPNIELNNPQNLTDKYFMETCFTPSTLRIPVVTESYSYGFFPFLSDLGGLLSILSITFALMFPLAQALIIPRSFIGLKAYRFVKKICWDEDDFTIEEDGVPAGTTHIVTEDHEHEESRSVSSSGGGAAIGPDDDPTEEKNFELRQFSHGADSNGTHLNYQPPPPRPKPQSNSNNSSPLNGSPSTQYLSQGSLTQRLL